MATTPLAQAATTSVVLVAMMMLSIEFQTVSGQPSSGSGGPPTPPPFSGSGGPPTPLPFGVENQGSSGVESSGSASSGPQVLPEQLLGALSGATMYYCNLSFLKHATILQTQSLLNENAVAAALNIPAGNVTLKAAFPMLDLYGQPLVPDLSTGAFDVVISTLQHYSPADVALIIDHDIGSQLQLLQFQTGSTTCLSPEYDALIGVLPTAEPAVVVLPTAEPAVVVLPTAEPAVVVLPTAEPAVLPTNAMSAGGESQSSSSSSSTASGSAVSKVRSKFPQLIVKGRFACALSLEEVTLKKEGIQRDIALSLEVPTENVTILSILSGSVIVEFTVDTTNHLNSSEVGVLLTSAVNTTMANWSLASDTVVVLTVVVAGETAPAPPTVVYVEDSEAVVLVIVIGVVLLVLVALFTAIAIILIKRGGGGGGDNKKSSIHSDESSSFTDYPNPVEKAPHPFDITQSTRDMSAAESHSPLSQQERHLEMQLQQQRVLMMQQQLALQHHQMQANSGILSGQQQQQQHALPNVVPYPAHTPLTPTITTTTPGAGVGGNRGEVGISSSETLSPPSSQTFTAVHRSPTVGTPTY